MKNKIYKIECSISDVKMDPKTGEFTCYGNVKGNVDHALDMTMNGAYLDSIKEHKAAGTMPGMFWMHKSFDLPVGVWLDMEEDEKGLKMKGRLSKTSLGTDIEILAKDGALKMFSIGYRIIDEKWNSAGGFNELRKIHITEVSWVTRACNEESVLLDIKAKMADGELPTKRELEKVLRDECGFSKRQANRITNLYSPENEDFDVSDDNIKELENMILNSFNM
jgi:HK97 family phage prohead protease